jgi:hypothetical protein
MGIRQKAKIKEKNKSPLCLVKLSSSKGISLRSFSLIQRFFGNIGN